MRAALLILMMLVPAIASAGTLDTLGPLRADSGDFPGAQDTGACTHRFTGTLENGDIAAFEAIATDNANYAVLCLDSPGGSFGEAVRIARLLSEKNIGTRIEGGAACESACALIFMAGRHVSEQAERAVRWRVLHPRGKLGFHAPALVVPEGNYDKDTVNRAYDVALGTVGSAITELILTGEPDGGYNIRMSLLGVMLGTPADSMHHITTTGEAGRWDIAVGPLDMPFPKDAKALSRGCMNAWAWRFDRAADEQNWGFPADPVSGEPDTFTVMINEISGDSCKIAFVGPQYPAIVSLTGRSGNGDTYLEAWQFTEPGTPLASLPAKTMEGTKKASVAAPASPEAPADATGECTVGDSEPYKDREPCTRSQSARDGNGGKELVITYRWPSGSETKIVRGSHGDTINGAPTALEPHPVAPGGECARNPSTGNRFCYRPN
ncbi:MAG: hypothetical protein KDJ73_13385 [Notoacmeibacter sp.]|nr:hypothetical protein [Notoacmeibacter sp.]MCC0033334.1 hypothetical protein [Brucellaceae bacterium]